MARARTRTCRVARLCAARCRLARRPRHVCQDLLEMDQRALAVVEGDVDLAVATHRGDGAGAELRVLDDFSEREVDLGRVLAAFARRRERAICRGAYEIADAQLHDDAADLAGVNWKR